MDELKEKVLKWYKEALICRYRYEKGTRRHDPRTKDYKRMKLCYEYWDGGFWALHAMLKAMNVDYDELCSIVLDVQEMFDKDGE